MSIFRSWRRQPQPTQTNQSSLPTKPVNYPFGTCVKTESGHFLIRDKVRFRIPSERVLQSWKYVVVETTEAAVKHFKIAGILGFRDGTLINNVSDGKLYIIAGNKKRQVVNPDWLDLLEHDFSTELLVSSEEANLHEDGVVLD